MIADLAHAPLGHLLDDADCFAVKAVVAGTSYHAHIVHLAVNTDNETAQDSTLNAFLIGMVGVLSGLVDEIDQAALATGELGLDVHIVKLIDLHVGLLGQGIDSSDMTSVIV